MRNHTVKNFTWGLMTKPDPQEIPDGAGADVLNWITVNSKIELRRGYAIVGTQQTGSGRISGLKVGYKVNNTQIPFRTRGQKMEYYDASLATPDWVEISSNLLGAAVITTDDPLGEDVSFANYNSLAGAQTWASSPNSGLYKIMVANPGSVTNEYIGGNDPTVAYNRRGHIAIKQNRMFLWRSLQDTGIFTSYIDKVNLGDYTAITAEVIGTGNGTQTTFTDTLDFKAAGTRRTCLAISVTDGVEAFTDDGSGVLTGAAGGTGTINYTTGAISVTFAVAVVNLTNVTCTYRWEDSSASTGIANFSASATRTAGQGQVFRQSDGGQTQAVLSLKDHEYCLHEQKIWDIVLTRDDTGASNTIFRDSVGVPNTRAAFATAEGIYAIDVKDQVNPRFVIVTYAPNSTEVRPYDISENLDLVDYRFDKAVVFPYNDYILFACRHKDSPAPVNNVVFLYNRKLRAQLRKNIWDKTDYYASCFDIYNGTLLAGDSVSANVQTLFSGLDDNESNISNYFISGIKTFQIKSLKKSKKITLEGEVGPDQIIRLYASPDRGPFVEILDSNGGPFVKGDGSYVDRSQRVDVGSTVIGSTEIGGGSNGVEAYHYERTLPLPLGRFRELQYKLVADNIGYASVNEITFRDLRILQDKVPRKYRE